MQAILKLLSLTPLLLTGCIATSHENVDLPVGPPVQNVSTPYDRLITCIATKAKLGGVWAVGEIVDATGKFSGEYAGTGKFVTQGAGDMMQTTLIKAKAESVVNRRDPRPVISEIQLGIRDAKQFTLMDYYITGSVNTLDFIPGAAAEVTIAGIGPRYRQNRAIVGLDLHLTDARTSEVLAAVNVSKQIFADEAGFGIGRFFGSTLVDLDISGQNREPLQLSLRSMLQFGFYEMLSQLNPDLRKDCQQIVDAVEGVEDQSIKS
ncbi:CsgG/HfaB family protein [uncultured Sneathiella sp.]|uniref:CsgG/HfaB family protein n=1 Tax=uncultured Sneathiella sp. TaxID=879315 RepID=UPI0030EB9ABB|tara:strand:+ start:21519 stop:22307 length:789 start_codon:yes stop_codon:yes gene_type:complete